MGLGTIQAWTSESNLLTHGGIDTLYGSDTEVRPNPYVPAHPGAPSCLTPYVSCDVSQTVTARAHADESSCAITALSNMSIVTLAGEVTERDGHALTWRACLGVLYKGGGSI